MSTTPTTNYGFSKITPGTEKDIWGPIQSTTLDGIDTAIKNRQDEAAAKLPLAGGTLTGKVNFIAGVAGNAPVKIPHGVAPTTPVDGDFWSTTAAFFVRINSTTHQLATSADLTAGLATKAASSHTHAESDVTNLVTDLAAKAPLASPTFTGTPTAPSAAAYTNTTQLATTAHVYESVTKEVEVVKTATYVLTAAEAGKMVTFNSASAVNCTVNSSVFAAGNRVDIIQLGAGQVTFDGTATRRSNGSKSKLNGQYAGGTIWFISPTEYVLIGNIAT
jgi:hypothetical protein